MENKTTTATNPSTKPVVVLTPPALVKIKSMMEKEGKAGYGLRFGVVTGGCAGLSYEMSFQKNHYDNDRVSEQGGIRIFINEESVAFVQGIVIDYIDTLKESGFKYKNPNAKSSCGCGTSFS